MKSWDEIRKAATAFAKDRRPCHARKAEQFGAFASETCLC